MTDDDSANGLVDLIWGHRITAVIYAAARLEIADRLTQGPAGVPELALASGLREAVMRRLMRALVAIGLCVTDADERYALTPRGRHLCASSPQSLKNWAIFEGEMLWTSWGGLLDSLRTGQSHSELLGWANWFEHMAQRPQDVALFDKAMASLTRLAIDDILGAYDFSAIGTLMDVGGGSGELLGAVLDSYERMRGIVFDLAGSAARANDHLRSIGLAARCSFVAGDFFAEIPAGADAIMMKSILHDWDDELCVTILRNCRPALPRGGRLLVIERLLNETPRASAVDRSHALSDLNMLRGPGGAERTASGYAELLSAGGFRVRRIVRAGRFGIVEAEPR